MNVIIDQAKLIKKESFVANSDVKHFVAFLSDFVDLEQVSHRSNQTGTVDRIKQALLKVFDPPSHQRKYHPERKIDR